MDDRSTRHDGDELLDDALKSYTEQLPRAGMEGRIVARIGSEPSRGGAGWRWGYALAAVLLVGVLLAVWGHRGPQQAQSPQQVSVAIASQSKPVHRVAASRVEGQRNLVAMRAALRPLPQLQAVMRGIGRPFPIAPLSKQERLLLELAAAPHSPLEHQQGGTPIEIAPLQISALSIAPLGVAAAQDPSHTPQNNSQDN